MQNEIEIFYINFMQSLKYFNAKFKFFAKIFAKWNFFGQNIRPDHEYLWKKPVFVK